MKKIVLTLTAIGALATGLSYAAPEMHQTGSQPQQVQAPAPQNMMPNKTMHTQDTTVQSRRDAMIQAHKEAAIKNEAEAIQLHRKALAKEQTALSHRQAVAELKAQQHQPQQQSQEVHFHH